MVAVMARTYEVRVTHGQQWWLIEVPEIPGAVSQARSLREVESMVRDLIAVMLEVPTDSFEINVHVELPEQVAARVKRVDVLRKLSADSQAEAALESRLAAQGLRDAGMSLRDVGEALNVSYQRAHQLVGAKSSKVDVEPVSDSVAVPMAARAYGEKR